MAIPLGWIAHSFAQGSTPDSTIGKRLSELIIQGSRNKVADNVIDNRKLAMPVIIIDKKTISLMGSRRLDEVLREQTGMAVVSDLGAGNRSLGLQMQGFSSEYILILIDGQPMAGRNNGNFDLSRISISHIERIEIIKGACSSLYGSEALGGVVNIVTSQQATKTQALAGIRYGTFNTADATLETETPFAKGKGATFLSANYYRTNGFNVNPYLKEGTTSPPYHSISLQGRARYQLGKTNTLHVTGRYASRNSVMTRSYGSMPTRDVLDESDLNTMIALNSSLSNKTTLINRYYLTRYSSQQQVTLLNNGTQLQSNNFREYIHRIETQFSHEINKDFSFIAGAGSDYQRIRAEKAGNGGHMFTYFGYTQATWKPLTTMLLSIGTRYDGNTVYGGKLNPSAGISYSPAQWITLKAAAGRGFKSPTYQQLYQVFTNITQGYTIIGANIFNQGAEDLRKAGQVQQLWPVAGSIGNLKPETSISWNVGFTLKPGKQLNIGINGFYNNIRNLINNQQVGIKTNGAQIFSWYNVARASTYGLETELHWTIIKGLTISGGYQLLYTHDKSVLDSINTGTGNYAKVRSPSAIRTATRKDYFGLPNRSRNMANLQVFYEYQPWSVTLSVRTSYRSKYGFLDQDNNGYIDQYDVFVNNYTLINASIQKRLLSKRLGLQLTFDNITNYTDYLMPAQPGRQIFAGATWILKRKKPVIFTK